MTLLVGGPHLNAWWLVPAIALTGLGSGLLSGPYFDLVITGVSERETGSASGALSASQQVSTAFGVAVFGSVFFALASHAGNSPIGFTHGFEVALAGIVVVVLLGLSALPLLPAKVREQDAA